MKKKSVIGIMMVLIVLLSACQPASKIEKLNYEFSLNEFDTSLNTSISVKLIEIKDETPSLLDEHKKENEFQKDSGIISLPIKGYFELDTKKHMLNNVYISVTVTQGNQTTLYQTFNAFGKTVQDAEINDLTKTLNQQK